MKGFDIKYLKNSAIAKRNPHLFTETKQLTKMVRKPASRSKEKEWLGMNLLVFCQAKNYLLEEEYRFHPVRRWRFDWAIPGLKIAIEYEGIFSKKSRHTTISGYSGDAEKYRAAAKLGWRVMRYTAVDYKKVIMDIEECVGG